MKHSNKLYGIGAIAIAASAIGGGASVASQALPGESTQSDSATLTVLQNGPDGGDPFSCVLELPGGVISSQAGPAFTVFAAPPVELGGAVPTEIPDPSSATVHAGTIVESFSAFDLPDGALADPADVRVGTDEECEAFDVAAVDPLAQVLTTGATTAGGAAMTSLGDGSATFAQIDENGDGFRCTLDVDDLVGLAPAGGLQGPPPEGAVFDAAIAVGPGIPVGPDGSDGSDGSAVIVQAGSIAVPAGATFEPAEGFEPPNIDELREGTPEECEAATNGFSAVAPG